MQLEPRAAQRPLAAPVPRGKGGAWHFLPPGFKPVYQLPSGRGKQRFQRPTRLFSRSPSRALPSPRPQSPSRTTFLSRSQGPTAARASSPRFPAPRRNGNRGALVPSHSLLPTAAPFPSRAPRQQSLQPHLWGSYPCRPRRGGSAPYLFD